MNCTPLEQRDWNCHDLVDTPCNLCGCDESTFLTTENDLNVVRCKDCQVVYVKPRPSDDELRRFYRQYLLPEASAKWEKATRSLFLRDAERIEKHHRTGAIFDIGCGFGFFLKLMQERGWKAYGCDLSETAVTHARTQLNLENVRYGSFQSLQCPENFFDAITAWYVLHHVSEPLRLVADARRALKPGGLIALRVPSIDLFKVLWIIKKMDSEPLRFLFRHIRKETGNPRAIFNVLDPPVHLYGYNPRILGNFLAKQGFKVTAVYNDGMVARGNVFNQIVDRGVTFMADLVKLVSRERLDLSISFSIYARKE